MSSCRSIAALYDIHGNLPALDAVLTEVECEHIERIVIGGDVVLGPMPRETLARVRALGESAIFIRGNCDRLVASHRGTHVHDERLPRAVREDVAWVVAQLSAHDLEFLGALPATVTLDIERLGAVSFCHATPRSDEELLTVETPDATVATMFEGTSTSLAVCGHTHMQFDRVVNGRRILNAGSVGMPYGEPGACWLSLGPDVRFRRTGYDLAHAAAAVRATTYPHADSFAANHVLAPPSKQSMLDLFAGRSAPR